MACLNNNHRGQVHRTERVDQATCPYDPWIIKDGKFGGIIYYCTFVTEYSQYKWYSTYERQCDRQHMPVLLYSTRKEGMAVRLFFSWRRDGTERCRYSRGVWLKWQASHFAHLCKNVERTWGKTWKKCRPCRGWHSKVLCCWVSKPRQTLDIWEKGLKITTGFFT